MTEQILLYGATGYTGSMMARNAARRGGAVLAGRDTGTLASLARELGLESRAFHLGESGRLRSSLEDIRVLVNVAGPFSNTWRPLADACLETGTHYLDLCGELPVFSELQQLDRIAVERDTMLMPGVGFLAVPGDCLAAHVARRLPGARRLILGLSRDVELSPGSARSLAELMDHQVVIRRRGELVEIPLCSRFRRFDFVAGPGTGTCLSTPELLTVYRNTGIPDIEVYGEVDTAQTLALASGAVAHRILGHRPLRAFIRTVAAFREQRDPEPTAGPRRSVVAEAEDADGRRAVSRLSTPGSYTFSSTTALTIAEQVADGRWRAGFQTPAGLFGADFVLGLEGVHREDLI